MENFVLETEKMPKSIQKVEVYNVYQVANLVSVSPGKIRDLVQRGHLQAIIPYVPGKKILIAKPEIERFFKIK